MFAPWAGGADVDTYRRVALERLVATGALGVAVLVAGPRFRVEVRHREGELDSGENQGAAPSASSSPKSSIPPAAAALGVRFWRSSSHCAVLAIAHTSRKYTTPTAT